MTLTLYGSSVKSWFQYRCERKAVYDSMPPGQHATVPIAQLEPVAAWAQIGLDFERDLVRHLAASRPGEVFIPDAGFDSLSEISSIAFLRRDRSEAFAYQSVLSETPRLREVLQLPIGVSIGRSKPDLLEAIRSAGGLEFRVIDIKAAQIATMFHKAQVAFYSLVLQAQLAQLDLPHTVAPEGQIWRLRTGEFGSDGTFEVESFSLASYQAIVLDFFHRKVPEFACREVRPGHDDTFFHVYFKCEQCKYLVHCLRAVEPPTPVGALDVSAVPGVSHESKRALWGMGIRSVDGLANARGLAQREGASSWTLKRRADVLVARARALLDDAPQRLPGRYSWLMPPRVDVGIYLAIDVDPVDGRIATLGYLRTGRGGPLFVTRTVTHSSEAAEREAVREVLDNVLRDLAAVDAHNAVNEPEEQLHAHLFLYEPSEAVDLQRVLGRHLDDPDVREGLLQLVRIFPPDDVIPEPEYHGVHHLPATAVRSVVDQLYALPVRVAYDLRGVTGAFANASPPLATPYRPAPAFERRFSSRLSIEVCRSLRAGSVPPAEVEADVRARLSALAALTEWIMADNERAGDDPFLRLRKRPFRFQSTFDPLAASDLDVLQAYEILKNRAGLLAALVQLAQPTSQRRDRLQCFAGLLLRKSVSRGRARILIFDVPPESRQAELSPSDIGLILTNDDPNIRLDPQRWPEFEASILEVDEGGSVLVITVRNDVFGGPGFQSILAAPGETRWSLDRTFKDYTSSRSVRFLRFLADGVQS
jgi:hypothetical protein